MEEVTFEALGPSGVPYLIVCVTDNNARTVASIRQILSKHAGRLADVKYLFEEKGVIRLRLKEGQTFEEVFELAVDGGAEDVAEDDEETEIEVTAPPSLLHTLTSLLASKTEVLSSEMAQVSFAPPSDEPPSEELLQRLEEFEDDLEEKADCMRVWRAI